MDLDRVEIETEARAAALQRRGDLIELEQTPFPARERALVSAYIDQEALRAEAAVWRAHGYSVEIPPVLPCPFTEPAERAAEERNALIDPPREVEIRWRNDGAVRWPPDDTGGPLNNRAPLR